MKRVNAMQKAYILVNNEQIFKICETPHYLYYIVKGNQQDTYDVIYHKEKDIYTCDCKNIRLKPCSHILAVRIMNGEIEGENGKVYKRNSLEYTI